MISKLGRCPEGHVFDLADGEVCPICGAGIAKSSGEHGSRGTSVDKLPVFLGAGTVGVALLGFAVFWLWPAPSPIPVPPQHDVHQVTPPEHGNTTGVEPAQPAKDNEPTTGDNPPNKSDEHAVNNRGEAPSPAQARASPATKPPQQAMLGNPADIGPLITQDQPSPDLRDAIALTLEDKHIISPLGRELLATTRGCYASLRQEYVLARSWMTSDIAKANPASMYWYALMAEKGESVPQDYPAALSLLASSAEAGFYYAQVHLAEIYIKGLYPTVPVNEARGKMWLIKAVKESRPEAIRLASEIGLKSSDYDPTFNTLNQALGRSYQDAFKIASALLKDNTTSGMFWTGTLTFYGQGTTRDQKHGRDLILKAARLYYWPALVDVANWTADGYETDKNPVEAAAVAYIARENIASPDEAPIVDKVIAALVAPLSAEQYQDLGVLLRGIVALPARRSD